MARGLLFSVLMSCVAIPAACIVPVELTPQRPVGNHRPVIVTDEVMPPYLQDVIHTPEDVFGFSVVVEDEDLDDSLSMRLFRGQQPDRVVVDDGVLTAGDATNPTQRRGTFPVNKYCKVLNVSGSDYISVRVTDTAFSNTQDDQTAGLFADIGWVLVCQ